MTKPIFSVCSIEPAGYKFAHFLYDACKYLCFGIESAGYDCCLARNRFYSDRINILIGSHNLASPAEVATIAGAGRYVLFQTEVITGNTINNWAMQKTFAEVYLPLMRQAAAVWTGAFNIGPLKKLGIDADVITFGYHPLMEELVHKKKKDIDFLYFGSLTDHRKEMVENVIKRGGKVVTMFDDAALFRNDLIARTKVNLAPHQGPGRNHMTGKILYLVNNRSIVAVEKCSDQELYQDCFPFADTEQWVDLCFDLLNSKDSGRQAEEYYERFRKIKMEDFLGPLIEKLVLSLEAPASGSQNAAARNDVPAHQGQEDSVQGMTSIIIVARNPESIKKCLKSVRRHTPEAHEIIFVDNGSAVDTLKWLRKISRENTNCRLIENDRDEGMARAYNQGINASRGEYIVLLSDDVIVTKDWLSGMQECMNSSSDTGIVGPMTNGVQGLQMAIADYSSPDFLDRHATTFHRQYRHRRIASRSVNSFCMLFNRDLVEKTGFLDESLDDGWSEDICLRSALAGYTNMIAGDVYLHKVNAGGLYPDRRPFDGKWRNVDLNTDLGKSLAILNALETGSRFYQNQQIDKAIDALVEGIKYYPDSHPVYYSLARMLLDARLPKDALEALDALPAEEKNSSRYLTLAGYCKEGLGLVDEAEKFADRALRLCPSGAMAINLKGIVAYNRSDIKTAEACFRKAIDADPGYGEPYTNLGVLLWASDDRAKGLDLLEKGAILSPESSDILMRYHGAITSSGSLDRGEKLFRDLKNVLPESRRVAVCLIDMLLKQSKYEMAIEEIQDAMVAFGCDDELLTAGLDIRGKLGPKIIDLLSVKRGTLSVCMIVKNEQRFLSKCLKSIQNIADEIIVVDTGSSDRTKDIAKIFGARVSDFAWTGDFSGARNESLSHAEGGWILVLDGDETVSVRDHAELRELTRGTEPASFAYHIVTRNYVRSSGLLGTQKNNREYPQEEEGAGWIPSGKVRIFPNDSRIRFEGTVHELVENSVRAAGLEIRQCKVAVHHYGKLDTTGVLLKGAHYYHLGLRKLEEDPDNAQALFELANQAQELEKYDEAIDLWNRAVAHRNERDCAVCYYNLGSCYLMKHEYEAALKASLRALELNGSLKEAAVNCAYSRLLSEDYEQAVIELEMLQAGYDDLSAASALLAGAYSVTGRENEAVKVMTMLGKKGVSISEFLGQLAERFASIQKSGPAAMILEALMKSGSGNPETERMLLRYRSSATS